MGLFNPLSLLAPAALIIISIPLVLFATATTVLAFSLLLTRVAIVYVELGLALIKSSLFVKAARRDTTKPPAPRSPTGSHHGRRRSSGVSTSPSQELLRKPAVKSDSYVSLLGAGAPGRDYEGVGGWRDLVDDQEESLWLGMNKRLELPMPVVERQRRHQRSLTGGSAGTGTRYSWSPEAMRMSPVQSRARTPSVPDMGQAAILSVASEEYFGLQPHGRPASFVERSRADESGNNRRKSVGAASEKRGYGSAENGRRKSIGGSSTSSTSSARSSKVTVKQTSWG